MPKGKHSLTYRILHFISDHPWLKLISLILAVGVWFYVRGEIGRFNY